MENEFEKLKQEFEEQNGWGLLSSIDLHFCNHDFIIEEDKLKEFAISLCENIKMKRFGEPSVIRFGEGGTAGLSVIQLIETSNIIAHFVDDTDAGFLDIFSCKFYNPKEVAEFAKQFFQAKDYKLTYLIRK
ncbi:MAG: S-adenosylmethionine decarboxylase [archaeon]